MREWRFHLLVMDQIQNCIGRAEVDLFASRSNTQHPLFICITDQNMFLGMDAMHIYAFPPVDMILPALERMQ